MQTKDKTCNSYKTKYRFYSAVSRLNFQQLRSGGSVCRRMGKLVVQVQPEHLPLCKTIPPHWLARVCLICFESITSSDSFSYFQSFQAFYSSHGPLYLLKFTHQHQITGKRTSIMCRFWYSQPQPGKSRLTSHSHQAGKNINFFLSPKPNCVVDGREGPGP